MGALTLSIGVVERKLSILYVLRDAIHLYLRVMDDDLGVRAGDYIDLSTGCLLLEEGSLTDTDADPHLRCTHVVEGRLHSRSVLLDHDIVVDVNMSASGSSHGLPLSLHNLLLLECPSSVGSILLQLPDVIEDVSALWLRVSFHVNVALLFEVSRIAERC